jgi:death-on-curing protein
MRDPVFLSIEQVLFIQQYEAALTNSSTVIRDQAGLDSAIAAPQASFGDEYLMDLFEMAATYIASLSMNHPFIDGNKRTAAGSAVAFLDLNCYQLTENYDEELADKVFDFITKKIDKEGLADYLRENSEQQA